MAELELYLIRHGIAAERGPEYPDDEKRPLTAEGLAGIRRAGRSLNELGVEFDLVLTSPLVRTGQTAAMLVEALESSPRVITTEALAPGGTTGDVLREVAAHSSARRLALVGHEPNIGELAAALLGMSAPLSFKKGAICRIDVSGRVASGEGELRWFLPPKVLRRIG
jgi:phosphohistidine phosphatase